MHLRTLAHQMPRFSNLRRNSVLWKRSCWKNNGKRRDLETAGLVARRFPRTVALSRGKTREMVATDHGAEIDNEVETGTVAVTGKIERRFGIDQKRNVVDRGRGREMPETEIVIEMDMDAKRGLDQGLLADNAANVVRSVAKIDVYVYILM